ncbi:hypothetical protein, partial [Vibrio parahaemolyticus]
MVDDYFERDLAIKGTPPEMAMYKSCLQNLGLHLERDHEDFDFVMPFVDNNATEEIKENQKKVNILWENAFDLIKERSDAGVVP